VQQGNLVPVVITYDDNKRPQTLTQGTRVTSMTYGGDGRLQTITDAVGHTTFVTRDAIGRVTDTERPDGAHIGTSYDANGNLISVTPPGKLSTTMTYTATDQLETSAAPPVLAHPSTTTYAYDGDRVFTQATWPSGATLVVDRDSGGRVSNITTTDATGVVGRTVSYDFAGHVDSITGPGDEAVAFTNHGPLIVEIDFTGTVAGTITRNFGTSFRIATEDVNFSSPISFTYDADLGVKSAGNLVLGRAATTGLLTSLSDGAVTTSVSYNGFGEPMSFVTSGAYEEYLVRDDVGRIVEKDEVLGGVPSTTTYSYDLAGRLAGANAKTFSYDPNGNRSDCVVDDQDRLVACGEVAYGFDDDGRMTSKVDAASDATTLYTYDALGNLLRVDLPDGRVIEYVIDGLNRRVGKKIDGVLVQGWLYSSKLQISAETDGAGNLTKRFVYATHANVPDAAIVGGIEYRVVSDDLGSVRALVNASDGSAVQTVTFDEFGNVTSDTNPGFQPFGFAGGLYDVDTGLVRFGARDYDALTGRWTSRDPTMFGGGDTDLYVYAGNDPVNLVDVNGLWIFVQWNVGAFVPCSGAACDDLRARNRAAQTGMDPSTPDKGLCEADACGKWHFNVSITIDNPITYDPDYEAQLSYADPDDFFRTTTEHEYAHIDAARRVIFEGMKYIKTDGFDNWDDCDTAKRAFDSEWNWLLETANAAEVGVDNLTGPNGNGT
jgi:RHS repeat-associated protein